MKLWLVSLLVVLTGLVGGLVAGVIHVEVLSPWPGEPSLQPVAKIHPKIETPETTYDFGHMDAEDTGSHSFVIKNVGNGVLKITKGATTCSCTLSTLEKGEIRPGGSATVTLQWSGKGRRGPFWQSAEILSNDPEWPRVVLKVQGRIVSAFLVEPPEIVFSRPLTAGEPASDSVHIFGYHSEPLEIFDWKVADPARASFFDASYEPLDAAALKEAEAATSGYLVRVTVKPGLPPGPFRQRIDFRTNIKDQPTVEVPVEGRVASDISIVGPGWSEELGSVMLGSVPSAQGAEGTLLIVARGPYHKDIQFKVTEVDPDFLQVDRELLQRTTTMAGGAATQARLKIRIPPGARPCNYLGSEADKPGRVIIETNHPTVPQLKVGVRFAVQG